MKLEGFYIDSFSIVISAKQNNPTILNPDFLKINKIVPEKMKLTETVTTPIFSMAKYSLLESGEKDREGDITITVEPEKLQLLESCGGEFWDKYISLGVVKEYITTLEHVQYTGLGINWQAFFEQSDPDKWLSERFIKDGNWRTDKNKVRAVSIKLAFDIEDATCFISLDQIKFKETPGIGIDINFHHSPKDERFEIDKLKTLIDRWPLLQKNLISSLKRLFNRE